MDQGLDLRFYIGVLRRRLLVMVFAFVVVAGGGFAVSVLLPPVFESQAKIIVESQQIPNDLVRSTVTGFAAERLQVIEQRITTREVLLGLVEKFNLFGEDRQELTPSELVERMRASIAIEQFDLGTSRRRSDSLAIGFTVGFQHRSPQVATRVANELVTLILAEDVKTRTASASETTRFIEREVEQRRKELAEIEAQISTFKLENDDALPTKLPRLMGQLERAKSRLTSIDREMLGLREQEQLMELELEIRKAAGQGLSDSRALTRSATQRELEALNAELAKKRSIYTDSHPDIKVLRNQIAALENQDEAAIAASAEAEDPGLSTEDIAGLDLDSGLLRHKIDALGERRDLLRKEKENVEQTIEELDTLIAEVPEVESYLNNLERRREAVRTALDDLTSKLNTARLGERLEKDKQGERFEVIEQPVTPTEPISPNRPVILLGGIGLAGGAALAIAVLLELLNRTVRTPADILSALGQSPVATIPYIATAAERRRSRGRLIAALLLIAGLVAAALLAIHFGYMPLDEVVYKVLGRFGL